MVAGRRVAGAGVAVWGLLDQAGERSVIARATIAIPGQHHAAYAEAFACRIALMWIAERGGQDRAVRVAGDNLDVLRFCAQAGRLRRPSLQALLEGPSAMCMHAGGAWNGLRFAECSIMKLTGLPPMVCSGLQGWPVKAVSRLSRGGIADSRFGFMQALSDI